MRCVAAWPHILLPVTILRFRFNVVGAKFLPPTGNALLDFLRDDWYYSLLLVLCIPTTLVAVYLNWLSIKFFRHA